VAGTNRIDEITGADAISFGYDANGNVTAMGDKSFAYNYSNRLLQVQQASVIVGEYVYNGLGQRVSKTVDGGTTVFHYDFDGNIIGESLTDGTFVREYLYLGGSRTAMVDVGSGEIYYYQNNHLGTPQLMTDESNTVVWEAKYKPFGEAEVHPSSIVENNFRFPGQYFDAESGLHYNYHRYYDPGTGRYLRADPIGLRAGLNLYAYVDGNPVNSVDPNGLTRWTGTSYQISAIALVGATFNRFTLESECVGGKKAIITVWAVGPSIGIGSRGTLTISKVSFEDFSAKIDPSQFEGIFLLAQAGITFHPGVPIRPPGRTIPPGPGPGIGVGASSIRLGNAFSDPLSSVGLSYGYDKSITGTVGTSSVMDVQILDCCE